MKKNKLLPVSTKLTLLTLVLCMSAFFIPTAAYAQSPADTTPPTVSAKLSGETLHIEASDDNSGVDAVFIDGKRINYRVDSAVDVPLKDYAGSAQQIGIQAVDFAGNKSSVVQIKNPYYKAPTLKPTKPTETKPTTKPSASASVDPETSADPKPFTPNGQATVTDNATDEDGKEFYTFTTPNENVFYLVIDKQRDSDNVYFLNAVTENDLAALAEKPKETEPAIPDPICSCKEKCEPGEVDTTCLICTTNLKSCAGKATVTTDTDSKPEKPKKEGNGGTMIFVLLAALAVGGAGYYFKIYKPKHDLDDAEDLDELLDNHEPEVNEDETTDDTERVEYAQRKAAPESETEAPTYDDYPDDDYPDDEPSEEILLDKRTEER